MQVLLALVVVCAALGCGRTLNPAFCADHPEDVDCKNAGLVAIDAPPGCVASGCMGDPNGTVCDMATQQCVQCITGVDTSACTGETAICDEDHVCKGCVVDSHCTSNVCLPTGRCAAEGDVLYARPGGTGDCSRADTCTFTTAVQMATTARHIIKLTATSGALYREPPITFAMPIAIQVLGSGTTFQPTGNGDAITVSMGNVEIVGLTVASATGAGADGVSCTGTARLGLSKTTIVDHAEYGVVSTGCTLTIERTRVSRNALGAMVLTAGTLEIRNNIIDGNGDSQATERGNVRILNAGGRFAFNTLADNRSKGGSDRVGGIECLAGPAFLAVRNIVTNNGGGDAEGGTCTFNNFTGDIAEVRFGTDYHLTMLTPAVNPIIRDDSGADMDCKINGKYIDDFDGQPRPVAGFCDRGADEFRP